ncbi:alginate lyase [Actinocorallia herbida]|uniref:Alginate lyase n=1 Tax=Actinocorallia herbida TaxID=58109 RepID=A0A3N1D0G4_9ACTN|nr:alginate lyase family protein [Actinocorallia herbida]ROO87004.1 alginate lyase [Actinocorallia herbida]
MNRRACVLAVTGCALLVALVAVLLPRYRAESAQVEPVAGSAAAEFLHPGVGVNRQRLDKVRKNLKKEPFKSAYAKLRKDPLTKPGRIPHPFERILCLPNGEVTGDAGCKNERNDSLAAYGDALIWYLSRNKSYLRAAERILDAYSAKVQTHVGDGGPHDADAPLQAAWTGINFTKAAEIIRYSQPKGKKWQGASRFGAMLRRAYVPFVKSGTQKGMNGNWDLASADATIGMAVYLNDHALYKKAIKLLHDRVPAYFYLVGDDNGSGYPWPPVDGSWGLNRSWYMCPEIPDGDPDDQLILVPGALTPSECPAPEKYRGAYMSGQTQETCRDLKHPSYGIDSALETAVTARIQGDRAQFSWLKKRLTAAMEFHARYTVKPSPRQLCGGRAFQDRMLPGALEIGYTQYHKSVALPNTRKVLLKQRKERQANEFVAWETLVWGTP